MAETSEYQFEIVEVGCTESNKISSLEAHESTPNNIESITILSTPGCNGSESSSSEVSDQSIVEANIPELTSVGNQQVFEETISSKLKNPPSRKNKFTFERSPLKWKRQKNRLTRKLIQTMEEYAIRVGQQVALIFTTHENEIKVYGTQPLKQVVTNCRHMLNELLQCSLNEQEFNAKAGDLNEGKFELPPLIFEGMVTPLMKVTQAQLRTHIPLMLKYSTGRGKPRWGYESTRPPWWPNDIPWANVRSDCRTEEQKMITPWTTVLRKIVKNCYIYHGREDMLNLDGGDDPDDESTARRRKKLVENCAVSNENSNNNNNNVIQFGLPREYFNDKIVNAVEIKLQVDSCDQPAEQMQDEAAKNENSDDIFESDSNNVVTPKDEPLIDNANNNVLVLPTTIQGTVYQIVDNNPVQQVGESMAKFYNSFIPIQLNQDSIVIPENLLQMGGQVIQVISVNDFKRQKTS